MTTSQVSAPLRVVAPSEWPTFSQRMSYSTLTQLEACPRRWSLSGAAYPDVWAGRGYPRLVTFPALRGEIIHGALEELVRALTRAGCSSVMTPEAFRAINELGGCSAVLSKTAAHVLARHEGNPRLGRRRNALARQIEDDIPKMRVEVQTRLGRMALGTASRVETSAPASPPVGRWALSSGNHPERELAPPGLGWTGRPDLIILDATDCTIIDFKTGQPKPDHAEQVSLYAWLWWRDAELNPSHHRATRLTLSYPRGDQDVAAPSVAELEDLGARFEQRARDVIARLPRREALPTAERTCLAQ